MFVFFTNLCFLYYILSDGGFVIVVKQGNRETKAKIFSVYATNFEDIEIIKKPTATTAKTAKAEMTTASPTMENAEPDALTTWTATPKAFQLDTKGPKPDIGATMEAKKVDTTTTTAMMETTTETLKKGTTGTT
jgi:hypothetical protein